MRWDSFSIVGNNYIQTPNIDRIAKEGLIFNKFYANYSLCAPSRASILTGQPAHVIGINNNRAHISIEDYPTMGKIFSNAGYQTAFIGKYHIKGMPRPQPGYDFWLSFRGSGEYINPLVNENGTEYVYEGHLTNLLTDKSLDFIENRNKEQPFLLVLMHKTPKGPYREHQKEFDTLLNNTNIKFPKTYKEDLSDKPQFIRESLESREFFEDGAREEIKRYYRHIKGLEVSVGEILNLLDSEHITDNSMVIFSGDHGFHHYEHNILGKRYAFEESIRIPLFIRYPVWFNPGTVVDNQFATLIDLIPTMMHAANIDGRHDFPGKSLFDLANNKTDRDHIVIEYQTDSLFSAPLPTYRVLRIDRFKYVKYFNTTSNDELYDLQSDPFEENNILFEDNSKQITFNNRLIAEMTISNDLSPDVDVSFDDIEKGLNLSNSGNEAFRIDEISCQNNIIVNLSEIQGSEIAPQNSVQINFIDFDHENLPFYDTIMINDTNRRISMSIPVALTLETIVSTPEKLNSNISIAPNPGKNMIELFTPNDHVNDIKISNMAGQVSNIPWSQTNIHTYELVTEELDPGIYVLLVSGNMGVYKAKFKKL